MKLTTVTTALKNNAVKLIAGAALAGAALTAAAPAAQAQRVFFGVHVGGPAYYAPAPPVVVYGRPGFYAPRYYGWRDRDDFRFRHDWDRRDFDHRGWDHRDFDHRGYDRR
jgi:hypothetical protein